MLGKQKTPQEIAKERHAARTSEHIKDIKNRWQARKNLNGGVAKLIDDTLVPEMNYHSEMPKRATLKDKLDNAIRGGIYYQGESGVIASGFSSCLDKTYDKSATQMLIKRLSGYYTHGNDEIVELPTIEHLMELRKFKDVDKIHPIWRKRYNELIDELNAYDYKKGVRDIVPKIEEAHNIMKLSTNTKALGFGLDKLSHRTPYQIFDEFEKAIPGFSKSCPKKEFFDAFPEYIPLFTGNEAGGAHFSRARKHVIISLKEDAERLANSVWYRDGLFYHEYGHAFDHLNGLKHEIDLKLLYQKWKDKIKIDNGVVLENEIKAKLKPYQDVFNDWWETSDIKKKHDEACRKARIGREYEKARKERKAAYVFEYNKRLGDIEEQVGGLSDCLMAFIGGTRKIDPRGHFNGYFSSRDKQLAEFIAHCSECFWGGNKYFKGLAPELYNEMVEWAKIVFKQK